MHVWHETDRAQLLRSCTIDDAARRSLLTVYLQLSVASRLLPRQLRLRGIELEQPSIPSNSCHEGLSHEYKGEYHGRQVCLKVVVLRNEETSMVEVRRKFFSNEITIHSEPGRTFSTKQ